GFPRRSEGHRQPRLLRPGAEFDRAAPAVVAWRSCRSIALDEDPVYLRRGWRVRGGRLRRPQFSFRHPRACHGVDLQWPRAVEIAPLRLRLSDLLRLH